MGAIRIAVELIDELQRHADGRQDLEAERPIEPGRVLQSILHRRPDGIPEPLVRPLTPLLDTTVLTNAPGEPAVAHEIRAEIPSADSVDILMAFIRWSGIRGLVDVLRRHSQASKSLRVLTTTYTLHHRKVAPASCWRPRRACSGRVSTALRSTPCFSRSRSSSKAASSSTWAVSYDRLAPRPESRFTTTWTPVCPCLPGCTTNGGVRTSLSASTCPDPGTRGRTEVARPTKQAGRGSGSARSRLPVESLMLTVYRTYA